jgi:LacI family transcriptional regulator
MPRSPLRLGAFLRLDAYHTHGLLRGLARFAREHPEIEILKLPQPARFSAAMLRTLRLDGLLARVTSAADEALLARLRVPVVNVSGERATPRLAWVNTDDERVGRMAWQHLADRGYKYFAYVGNRTHLASLRRRESLHAAAAATGAGFFELELARHHESTPFPGPIRRRLARWLKTLPRPVGLLGFNDRVALELAEACALAGLTVPTEVAIMGVGNDLTRLEFAPTAISSIDLPAQQIGYEAATWLLAMVQRRRESGERRLAPPKIVARRSTDALAVDDEVVAGALDFIRENRGNTIYVDEVARAAGVSRRVLEKRFRRTMQTSVYRVAQRVHLERAQELLADPQLSLAEVAYASGYESPQHLHLAFRKYLRQTPGEVRQQLGSALAR